MGVSPCSLYGTIAILGQYKPVSTIDWQERKENKTKTQKREERNCNF
jgi:hypothetical protein